MDEKEIKELKHKMKEIHEAINVCECIDNHTCSVCKATNNSIDTIKQS